MRLRSLLSGARTRAFNLSKFAAGRSVPGSLSSQTSRAISTTTNTGVVSETSAASASGSSASSSINGAVTEVPTVTNQRNENFAAAVTLLAATLGVGAHYETSRRRQNGGVQCQGGSGAGSRVVDAGEAGGWAEGNPGQLCQGSFCRLLGCRCTRHSLAQCRSRA